MSRYLDPKNDLIFKRIFGEHKELCISLLNSLLPLKKPITSIEYRATELTPETKLLKNTSVDVQCTASDGSIFIVEMQMHWSQHFQQRVLLNASKAYVKQLKAGESFKFLHPVYSLNLVNEVYDRRTTDYYHHYKIVNVHNTEQQIKGLEFVFVELPKFKAATRSHKKLQVLWLRFLTELNNGTDTVSDDFNKDKNLKAALELAKRGNYDSDELDMYDRVLDAIMTHRMFIEDAEEKGMKKGEAERAQLQQALADALARIAELEK
ncbi:hypothetical protein FACS1894121_1900 [Bacteroidia bacterium]|nr:hypothetical protein FACS1894121_1900 [Bacteroidia bacterium]